MLNYNPNYEYKCSPNLKCKGFSYLQYLVIHYNKINNCL